MVSTRASLITDRRTRRSANTVLALTPGISWLYSDGKPEKIVPEFDATVDVVASRPANGATCSTPRVLSMISVACFTTSSVRASVAPGGS
jgi:hypothetical protein